MSDREKLIADLLATIAGADCGGGRVCGWRAVCEAADKLRMVYPPASTPPVSRVWIVNGDAYRDYGDAVKAAAKKLGIDETTAAKLFTRPDVRQWVGTHNGDKPNGVNIEPMEVL